MRSLSPAGQPAAPPPAGSDIKEVGAKSWGGKGHGRTHTGTAAHKTTYFGERVFLTFVVLEESLKI